MAKLPFRVISRTDRDYTPVDSHVADDLILAAQDWLANPKDPKAIEFYTNTRKLASHWVMTRGDQYPLTNKLLSGRPILSFRRKTEATYFAAQTISGLTAKLPGHAERRREKVMFGPNASAYK